MKPGIDYTPIQSSNLLELKKLIDQWFKEISNDLDEGLVQSHTFPAHFDVVVLDSDNNVSEDDYEIAGYDISYMMGCGCPQGIRFILKKMD